MEPPRWHTNVLIPRPWCGDREEVEFRYGGPVPAGYPPDPQTVDDRARARYLYYRPHPKGALEERWVPTAASPRPFRSTRDTATHQNPPASAPRPCARRA